MFRLITIYVCLLLATPALSQDWATRDVCFVENPQIMAESIAPATLEQLEDSAREIVNSTGRYWRIQTPDSKISYLWGTFHSNDPRILALPDRVENQIERSRVVAVERDFVFSSRADYSSFARGEYRFLTNVTHGPFAELTIPTRVKTWIRERLTGLGWDIYAADYLTLAALAEILLADPCEDFAYGTYPIQDGRIQMLGAIAGAEIMGLETKEAFREKLSAPEEIKLAEAVIAIYGAYMNPERTAADTATAFALYLQGRIGAMMALDLFYIQGIFGERPGTRLLERTNRYLLSERNKNFLIAALPELQNGGVFMAIGAFHLPGKDGMIERLRREGFVINRISLPEEAL